MSTYTFEKGQVWDIKMKGLGRLAWWTRGNQKTFTTQSKGENSAFRGDFCVQYFPRGDSYEFDYGCNAVNNSWLVSRILDKVAMVSEVEADGVFYWRGIRICKFKMRRVVHE